MINWIPSKTNIGGIKLSFGSDSIGWAGINFNIIAKTSDKGVSWYYQNSAIFNNDNVSSVSNLQAWAGRNGLVHTITGGDTITGINQAENSIASGFILYQNYPNPFNPNTIVRYELRVTSYVKLSVYDITGKHVTFLVNQRQNVGAYKIEFKGEALNSGIYFYKLEILNVKSNQVFSDTKKMILVK